MKDEIKQKPAVGLLPLILSPEMIKVHTISLKIVDQLPRIPLNSGRWLGHEIIGRLPGGGTILLRHSVTGNLSRMDDVVYLEERVKELGQAAPSAPWTQSRDQASAELAALPQIFTL